MKEFPVNNSLSFLTKLLLLSLFSLTVLGWNVAAQDTTKKRTIDITSTFKPVLKDAVKVNFHAGPLVVDTAHHALTYNIPSQFLFLNYQPAELKPVALQVDSANGWDNDNYIKFGIGNVHQPYLKTGFSFGDHKNTLFNLFADQFTSKGSLPYQKNSLTRVALNGTVKTAGLNEWDGGIGFKSDGYYLYGYRPDSLQFSKEQLQQRFQTFDGKLGFRNLNPTEFGLTYHPNLRVSVFSDNHDPKASEANTVLELPLQKQIGKSFGFNLSFTGDLTSYRRDKQATIENNLYYVSPDFLIKTPNLYLQASVIPSWDNGAFTLLPNFIADITTNDQRFAIQLGWIGYYDKGSYQRFASINPWLAQPGALYNTRLQERYAGFRGSLTDHFTYSAKVGFIEYHNAALFVNDTTDGKNFLVRYEPKMEALQFHGEIAYTQGEQFNLTASINFNQYTKLQNELKAWGMLPLELRTSMKWQLMKDLWLKADLWAFDGAQYLAHGESFKGEGAIDLNAGIEFRITRQLNLWFQMNNIFNNKYERWHQYESYGFNVLGGIIFSFKQL